MAEKVNSLSRNTIQPSSSFSISSSSTIEVFSKAREKLQIKREDLTQNLIAGFIEFDFSQLRKEIFSILSPIKYSLHSDPKVQEALDNHFEDRMKFLQTTLSRIEVDLPELTQKFTFDAQEIKKLKITFTNGDSHNCGESPLFLTFTTVSSDKEIKIVYKPRSLIVDSHYCNCETGLFAKIQQDYNINLPTRTFLLRERDISSYGYESYVEGKLACEETNLSNSILPLVVRHDRADFSIAFKQFEEFINKTSLETLKANYVILASLIQFGASDQHFGNFIINKDNMLIPIDLEAYDQKINGNFLNQEFISADATLQTCLKCIRDKLDSVDSNASRELDRILEQYKEWVVLDSYPNRCIPISTQVLSKMRAVLFEAMSDEEGDKVIREIDYTEDTGSGGLIVNETDESDLWSSAFKETQSSEGVNESLTNKTKNEGDIKEKTSIIDINANAQSLNYKIPLNALKESFARVGIELSYQFEIKVLNIFLRLHIPYFTFVNRKLYLNREEIGLIK